MRPPIHAVVAALLLASGCGGVDLSGMYQVEQHAVDDQGCSDGAAPADPLAYLRFTEEEFIGQEYFQYTACTGPDPGTCDPAPGLFALSFSEEIDGGWAGTISSASSGGTTCLLSYLRATALLDGATVTIDQRRYEITQDVAAGPCTADAAAEAGASLPCAERTRIVATQL